MPPPGGMAGIGVSFFGFSATIASVVINSQSSKAALGRLPRLSRPLRFDAFFVL